MNYEKIDGNKVKVTYEVSASEFNEGLDSAFVEAQKKVQVPGFRKGHVSRAVFEQKYGVESLFEDALNFVINKKYDELFSNPDFEIVGKPSVDLDWATVKKDQGFTFTVTAPVKPEVKLGEYKGLEVVKTSVEVTNDEVEAKVNDLFKDQIVSEIKQEGTLEKGDIAILNYQGLKDGVAFDGGTAENATLEIGSNTFIPGFEDQMVGMAKGEEKDLNLTFPENYGAKDLAGKEVVFKVKLNDIKVNKKPEITDEMVVNLKREGISTVQELKENEKAELEKAKENNAKNKLEDDLITLAVANSTFTPSKEMIENEKNALMERAEKQYKQYGLDLKTFLMYTNQTEEAFKAQTEMEAAKRISSSLVLEAIIKAENIEATKEDIDQKYQEYAKAYNMDEKEIKKYINAFDVDYEVRFRKAIDLLVSTAKIN